MKFSKIQKITMLLVGVAVTVALFLLGHNEAGEGVAMANTAVISLSEVEKAGFNDQEKKMVAAVEKLCNQVLAKANEGKITEAEVKNFLNGMADSLRNEELKAVKDELTELTAAAEKQGTSITQILGKMAQNETGGKSISQVLKENEDKIKEVYKNRVGTVEFMIEVNHKGEFVMTPYDPLTKAAGPHATVANVGGAGNTPSIAQSIDAASLLRLGGDAPIVSQYRNGPWIFDLCNLVTTSPDQIMAMWYEEQAKQGASATVAEGATKPLSQYAYTLKTDTYKKEATLIGFTDEFNMDFVRLQNDVIQKGRIDVVNRINSAVLARVIAAATAYNTATSYKNGAALSGTNYNDYITIDALAAQVDANTFGAMANAAVMSTYKKHRVGVQMDANGMFLSPPPTLSGLSMVGNPAMATDDLLVGDFKQYNILLRGGLILKVGYNGTDFAENRFSVVLEQYYFDYISTIRSAAIVKGQTFAAVKTALTT